MLRTLVEGLRTVTVLLWPYIPDSGRTAAGRAGRAGAGALTGCARRPGGCDRVSELEPLFPKDEPAQACGALGMIDSHTHLDLCEPPNAELVAAAERRA